MFYDLEKFGNKIKDLRHKFGYTQKDVSELTTLSLETLRKIENGKIIPRQITLELLSNVFKEDLNQLLLNYRISDFKEFYELRDTIEKKLENGQYDNLHKDLDKLHLILNSINAEDSYVYKLTKQLIFLIEAIILYIKHKDYNNSLEKLIAAMQETIPGFNMDNYNKFVYSTMEIRILMNIALVVNRLGDKNKNLEILKFCVNALDPNEEELKIKVLYNLSYSYYRNLDNEKSLYYANEGIKTCIENNKLNNLGLLYSIKGMAEYFLNDKNYINSFKKATILYDITGQDNFKDMLINFYQKHNIKVTSEI